jgi:hypothetical protein
MKNATLSKHFLLVYRDKRCANVAIFEAPSLAAARMKAAKAGLDTAKSFRLGHELEAELIRLVPPAQVGRILTPAEAKKLMLRFVARWPVRTPGLDFGAVSLIFIHAIPPDRTLRWAPFLPIVVAGNVIVAALAWLAISLLVQQ